MITNLREYLENKIISTQEEVRVAFFRIETYRQILEDLKSKSQ
jgi:hypothetical protein